ncbi:DNA polymerase III subunit delta [Chloroflexota bacterium]
MLYILWGQDEFSINQALEGIKRNIGDPSLLATNTTTLDGREVTLEKVKNAGETVPFLAEKRLVIIRGLMERFDSRARPRRKKTTRPSPSQNEYTALADCMNNLPDSTVMVLIADKIKGSNPLLTQLSPRAKVMSFPLLRGARLKAWIGEYVAKEGSSISTQATDLLANLVGSNLWIMANEITKLALFAAGRRIEAADVKAVVSYSQETSVFAMVDAILAYRSKPAGELLHELLKSGAAPAYLLVMLSRQVQRMLRAKELKNQRKGRTEIQNRLGIASEFVLNKVLEQADRYPMEQLKEVYRKLLETDLSIKTGKYNGDLALIILIAELSRRPG